MYPKKRIFRWQGSLSASRIKISPGKVYFPPGTRECLRTPEELRGSEPKIPLDRIFGFVIIQ
jgi:hypothetical protein